MADKITVTAVPIPGTPTFTIAATLVDDAGQPIAGQKVSFKVDPSKNNKIEPKEVDTDAEGRATATLTPAPRNATLTIIGKSGALEDHKEVTIAMSALDEKQKDLDAKQADLERAKQELQTNVARAAKLELEMQKLQEAVQLQARADLAAQVKKYESDSGELTKRAADLQAALDELTKSIKGSPQVTDARLKQIEEKRAKTEADIKAKTDQLDKLTKELDQLKKDVESASRDVASRQKELDARKESPTKADTILKELKADVDKVVAGFKQDDPQNVIITWFSVLKCRARFEKDVKPLLVAPGALQTDLETKQKALDEANSKLRKLKLQLSEKQAAADETGKALQEASEGQEQAILDFIANLVAG